MKARRHKHVVNADEIEPNVIARGKHRATRKSFTAAAGNAQLGASLMEIPPGGMSYPIHFHCSNEEAFYVISGTGTVRIGEERVAVKAGDWIAFPVGPDNAHQMINDGDVPLVYLSIGTDHKCDVIGYPDSKKVMAVGGPSWDAPWIFQIVKKGETLDYWHGEPAAEET